MWPVAQTGHGKRILKRGRPHLDHGPWCNRAYRRERERQLSHWDPVCHRPHLTHTTLTRAVRGELSLDIWLWLYCATPSMSPHRIKPSAVPFDVVSALRWNIWLGGWGGLELCDEALSKTLNYIDSLRVEDQVSMRNLGLNYKPKGCVYDLTFLCYWSNMTLCAVGIHLPSTQHLQRSKWVWKNFLRHPRLSESPNSPKPTNHSASPITAPKLRAFTTDWQN